MVCRYENATIASVTAMMMPIGVTRLSGSDPADQQDAQDFLRRIRDRGQRIG
jgi:hypothetical protein